MTPVPPRAATVALLRWYAEMGVDDATGEQACDWYARADGLPPTSAAGQEVNRVKAASVERPPLPQIVAIPVDEAVASAERIAAQCKSYEELEAMVRAFDGCGLKAGAKTTVFADGVPGAELLVIGEAPGRDEDAVGKPFVGRAGQLLDKMLAAINRSRTTNTLISNVVYWRPPGNRAPTQIEIAVCRPFVDRLIELTAPKAILIAGGVSMQALLGIPGIMRARGVWRTVETGGGARIDALPIFHPAFLLRSPAQKRLAWADLIALERRLSAD